MPLLTCSRKADPELCRNYYRKLAGAYGTHPAIQSALRTGEARNAIIEHCLEQEKSRIECALEAETESQLLECESGESPSMFQNMWKRMKGD
jgi:hypothetical protein